MDELCMVGRAYGHFQMAHTPLFETISEALPKHKLAEALKEDGEGAIDRCVRGIHMSY